MNFLAGTKMLFAIYFASGALAMGGIGLFIATLRLRRTLKEQRSIAHPHLRTSHQITPPLSAYAPKTDWDVAETETGRVEYRWLNITGFEDQ